MSLTIRCPDCGYTAFDVVLSPAGKPFYHYQSIQNLENDFSIENQLELFDVLGSDEGNVFCPECANEFKVEENL